jgi:hypothetical protein
MSHKRELFSALVSMKKEVIDRTYDNKTLEEDLKYGYASDKDFRKKDDTVDTAMVKADTMKTAIGISYLGKKNKIAEKYDTLEEYISDVNSGVFDKAKVKSFVNNEEEIVGLKTQIKDTRDSKTGILEKDEIKAIEALAAIVAKSYKQKVDDEWKESQGKEVTVKADTSALDELIIKLAKELGVTLN